MSQIYEKSFGNGRVWICRAGSVQGSGFSRIRCLGRRSFGVASRSSKNVSVGLMGEIGPDTEWSGALSGVETIFHLAAWTPPANCFNTGASPLGQSKGKDWLRSSFESNKPRRRITQQMSFFGRAPGNRENDFFAARSLAVREYSKPTKHDLRGQFG